MRKFRWALSIAYIYFILTQTVIGRQVLSEPTFRGLFWDVQNGYWRDVFLNILLFIPLGLLIGEWKGIIIGLVLSFGIELFQYFSKLGFCQLDDLINNVIGVTIGVLLAFLTKRVIRHIKMKYD